MVSLNPSIIIDIGMAIGPIVGYISQYSLIKNIKSIGSFSIDICGILLFANILRLNFYVFERFSTALVFQSIFMITMQIILVRECSKYMHKKEGDEHSAGTEEVEITLKDNEEENNKVESFWRWTGFEKYGVCILFFTFCTSVLTLMFYWSPISSPYGGFIGFLALTSESGLSLPQIIKNYQKKSTKGLSYLLVTFNILGDIGKLTFFIMNKQPFQFIICGVIQVILDLFVIAQICYYRGRSGENTISEMKHSKVLEFPDVERIEEGQKNGENKSKSKEADSWAIENKRNEYNKFHDEDENEETHEEHNETEEKETDNEKQTDQNMNNGESTEELKINSFPDTNRPLKLNQESEPKTKIKESSISEVDEHEH